MLMIDVLALNMLTISNRSSVVFTTKKLASLFNAMGHLKYFTNNTKKSHVFNIKSVDIFGINIDYSALLICIAQLNIT